MIHYEKEYKTTLERISQFQKQVEHLRRARNTSLKVIINDALRQGLRDMTKPPR